MFNNAGGSKARRSLSSHGFHLHNHRQDSDRERKRERGGARGLRDRAERYRSDQQTYDRNQIE